MGDQAPAIVEPPPAKARPAPQAAPRRNPGTSDPRAKPKRQPPYAVIVLNDDAHTYEYVILGLSKVFGYSTEKSYLLAQTIDLTGRATVWTGMLEVAELKREQILGLGPDRWARKTVRFPLGVVLEPLPP
ncbi:MAG: ATP-dependent Clp protease adaptor ClpS [Tepidisphaeraceae bacterium]